MLHADATWNPTGGGAGPKLSLDVITTVDCGHEHLPPMAQARGFERDEFGARVDDATRIGDRARLPLGWGPRQQSAQS